MWRKAVTNVCFVTSSARRCRHCWALPSRLCFASALVALHDTSCFFRWSVGCATAPCDEQGRRAFGADAAVCTRFGSIYSLSSFSSFNKSVLSWYYLARLCLLAAVFPVAALLLLMPPLPRITCPRAGCRKSTAAVQWGSTSDRSVLQREAPWPRTYASDAAMSSSGRAIEPMNSLQPYGFHGPKVSLLTRQARLP